MPAIFNNRLRQLVLLLIIALLAVLLLKQLYIFLPGFLGAITLYILTRKWFQQLTRKKKWNKGLTAILFITGCLIIIAIPVYLTVIMVTPKISSLLNNQQEVIQGLQIFSDKLQITTGIKIFSNENTQSVASRISTSIPDLLNSTATELINLLMLFFILYYLLVNGTR
jgi:predicted PurR-regulated permease PerM